MAKRNQTVLIIPWYGRLPPYFGTYLKSLEGRKIDVLWISDTDPQADLTNFRYVHLGFDGFKRTLSKEVGFEVAIDTPRRLSDFKPMLGMAFREAISDYGYWGWGDCGLVYGRKFDDFLERTVETGDYDVVSMRKEYLSGPSCFMRNTPELRELFKQARNWRENCTLVGMGRTLFDECGGEFHDKLNSGEMSMEDCAGISDSMSAVVWRTPGLQVYRENIVLEDSLAHGEVIHMEDDVLTCDGREIAAFHFILAKVPNYFRYVEMPRRRAGRFWIDKTGFYYGQFAWSTRVIRRPWRMSVAALSSLHRHGLRHVLKRLGV